MLFYGRKKRLYRAYIRSSRCKKQKLYTYIRDENVFSFRLCASPKAFSHLPTQFYTQWNVFSGLSRLFLFPRDVMGKIFFSAAVFCDGKRFATFGWSFPTLLLSSLSICFFLHWMCICEFFSTKIQHRYLVSKRKSYVFFLKLSCFPFYIFLFLSGLGTHRNFFLIKLFHFFSLFSIYRLNYFTLITLVRAYKRGRGW